MIFGCAGQGSGGPLPSHSAIDRHKVEPGEYVVVNAGQLLNNPEVTIADDPVTTFDWEDQVIRFQVPPGTAEGGPTLKLVSGGKQVFSLPITVGPTPPDPEVEPNDQLSGQNATPVPLDKSATGSLTSTSDRDTFLFGDVSSGFPYRITVSPPGRVSTVTVESIPYALDGFGQVTVNVFSSVAQVAISGGTGSYTVELEGVGPGLN